jgi:hypothetical protein
MSSIKLLVTELVLDQCWSKRVIIEVTYDLEFSISCIKKFFKGTISFSNTFYLACVIYQPVITNLKMSSCIVYWNVRCDICLKHFKQHTPYYNSD